MASRKDWQAEYAGKRLVNAREPLFLMYRPGCIVVVMSDTVGEAKPTNPKAAGWAERVAAQQHSGLSVKQFCREQGVTEYSFYAWRKRLQESGPVRFAVVERIARRQERAAEAALELVLATGERLRIGPSVNLTTLRTVLDVLRR